jgi:hypothetical protein
MQYGISYKDIYNFNEIGFIIGLIVTTKVVIRANMPRKPHLIQLGNWEWVTIIKCVNTTSWVLPSCIIFKRKVYIKGWYQDHALPPDWRIKVS